MNTAIAKLLGYLDALKDLQRPLKIGHQSTRASGRDHSGANNHGQGESKKHRLMAKESRKKNLRYAQRKR
jgi:hypothetical protein